MPHTPAIPNPHPAWVNAMLLTLATGVPSPVLDPPPDSPSLNVPLLVGLVSGFGTLFLSLLIGILWFALMGRRSISLGSLGNPGDFDDEQALLEAEEEALVTMDDVSRRYYLMAKAFITANPPNSVSADISLSQFLTIQEKGVSAWEFEVEFPNATCFVEGRTEIEFFDSTCCSQTNLPVPRQNEVYYWEAKMYDKPETTIVSVGLSTKPYPTFRLPGYHRYSVAYDSLGTKRMNQPFFLAPGGYGPPLQQGDVVGVGYRPRTGTVFFTRNGKKLDDALHGMRLNLFPTVGATGPCKVAINFGQAGFVFIEANVKKWGLAPAQGSLAPPPPYGAEQDFVLLEAGSSHQQQQQQQSSSSHSPPPPHPPTLLTSDSSSSPLLQLQHSGTHQNQISASSAHDLHQQIKSSLPPSFRRSLTGDDPMVPPGAPNDQVNISLESLASSTISGSGDGAGERGPSGAAPTTAAAPTARVPPEAYVQFDTRAQPLLSHSPPPSYTSETESIHEGSLSGGDDEQQEETEERGQDQEECELGHEHESEQEQERDEENTRLLGTHADDTDGLS